MGYQTEMLAGARRAARESDGVVGWLPGVDLADSVHLRLWGETAFAVFRISSLFAWLACFAVQDSFLICRFVSAQSRSIKGLNFHKSVNENG